MTLIINKFFIFFNNSLLIHNNYEAKVMIIFNESLFLLKNIAT